MQTEARLYAGLGKGQLSTSSGTQFEPIPVPPPTSAVRTEMTGGQGMINADESARGVLRRIDELRLKTTGRFVHQSGEVLPW